ncbi:Maf family nucleotide pyrophosphatase [Acinetobacter sp. MD2(2019)]|uniref:Maf family nucleotide pyrophosphatase n=1 Tax=Acinetobacter sp. MD2(2019) TaxID=2605273 RepID=UPI002D1E8B40|nr:Maf family nucleotide pyrophosphatase [Acinetobacter sp. MD2(2019)]MEB3753889.1 septum formation inhibitor Maf [Acinetobacter sp. MD2(2019)]
MARLILASSSPRRQELLKQLGLEFEICSPEIDEIVQREETATEYVERLAKQKAHAVWQQFPNATIIAADTCLSLDNEIIGKPLNKAHAFEIWQKLSGRMHDVLTGVCVMNALTTSSQVVKTQVQFQILTPHDMEYYWASKEPQDKAGGYAIQGIAAQFIPQIVGSYTNVVGLPLHETAALLKAINVLN